MPDREERPFINARNGDNDLSYAINELQVICMYKGPLSS